MESVGGENCVDVEVKFGTGGGEPLCCTGGSFTCTGGIGCSWRPAVRLTRVESKCRPVIKIHELIKPLMPLLIRSVELRPRTLASNPLLNVLMILIMISPPIP